jgi:hypothetical protein
MRERAANWLITIAGWIYPPIYTDMAKIAIKALADLEPSTSAARKRSISA